MRRKNKKSIISFILALVLAFTSIPMDVHAEEEQLTNLALGEGVTVEASSYESGTNYTADKVVDGNLEATSRWGTNQNAAAGEWIEINLGDAKSISEIVIHFERPDAEQNILGYHVELWNGTAYEPVHTKTEKAAQTETITFDAAKTASKVKVVIDNADAGTINWVNVGIREIQVFGVDAEDVTTPEPTPDPIPEGTVTTENTNHVRTATMSAHSVEDNNASFNAAKAGDGKDETRWSSDYSGNSNQWLKATFSNPTKIKHIKVTFYTRNVAPTPSNVSQFSIKYTDANNNVKYAVQNYSNESETSGGYKTDVSIVLEGEIVATDIQLCEFVANADSWNNIGIVELEAYSNEITASTILNVGDMANKVETDEAGTEIANGVFTLPEVPERYSIALNGADFEQILDYNADKSGYTVVQPLTDKEIQVSYIVTDTTTEETVITDDITCLVKGKYTQADGKNAKPAVIPEIQEWYSDSTGKLSVNSLTKVTYSDNSLSAIVDEFIADYKDFTDITLTKIQGAAEAGAFNFVKEAPDALLGEEGYTMDILADRVNVKSESITGNMYGMQTILQMVKQDAEGFAIGSMRDYPRFEVRGFMLDIARKPVGMEMIREISRTMRYYKMNDFQLHLSDNYIFLENYGHGANENEAFKAYEAFRLESDVTNDAGESPTAKDYYITKAEMREFIQSQRALGMNIVPEIDLPAHATSFTKIWPELMVTGKVSPLNGSRPLVDHIDVSKAEAIAKIKEIFDDYTKGTNPTFDEDTIVHVGADEFVTNYTAYRNFVNQIVPHVKATNPVRMWGGLTWIDDGVTEIIPEAIENVEMNLWSSGWADGIQMYNMGYKLINTIDSYNYMVPNGGMGRGSYGDLLDINSVFNSFEPNKVSTRNGWVSIPSGDAQTLGAVYAIWNDNIDKHSSGLTESDLYWRFFDALPVYAEKNWAATGQEKGSAAILAALAQNLGTGPRTNPYYQEDKVGGTYESYDFTDGLKDTSANGRNLTAGTATVENGALTLSGGNSYVTTPIDKIGNGNELSFDITLTKIPAPGDILFETTPEYATHDIRIMEDGKLGFTRELHNYYFDYELPVGKKVNIRIVAEQQDTTLYADGKLIGEAVGKFIHNGIEKKTGISHSTFAIPLERIGSETKAIAAVIDNVIVKQISSTDSSRDVNPANMTVYAENHHTNHATEGDPNYVLDGDKNTLWHTNYAGSERNTHYLIFTFDEVRKIDGMRFMQRQSGVNGVITKYQILIKENETDAEWKTVVADGILTDARGWQRVDFDAVYAKQVKLQVVEASSDNNSKFAAAAEVRFTELLKMDADYSAVDAALAKVPSDLTAYTDETAQAVRDAVNVVVRGYSEVKQAEVDAMAKTIEDAIDGLVFKDADYSKVNAALAKVPSDLSKYTEATVKAVNDAKAAVTEGLDITKQSEVDAMAKAIEDAVAALKEKEVQKPSTGGSSSGNTSSGNTSSGSSSSDKKPVEVAPAPQQPATPAKPATPATPAKPATPATPAKPATPATPAESAKPAEPAKTVEETIVDTKIVEEEATEEVKEAVKETVTVTEEKAVVTTETVEKVIENTEKGATVILPLKEAAEEGQAVKEAEVPVEALEKIVKAESALTVEFEGVKITLEPEAIKAIAEQAKGSTIELRVVPVEHHELHEEQQKALEKHDVAVRVSAQIFSDGEYIGDFKGGKARIAIPFTPAEGRKVEDHSVYFIADNGAMTLMPSTYAEGYMILETEHFSDYAIVYEGAEAEYTETKVEEDAVTEEAPVEEAVQEEKAGTPILPIIIGVAVVTVIAAYVATKKKNGEK